MKVIDIFLFSEELDILEVRLRELKPYVDVFIVAEAPFTFSGRTKSLVFQENRERFKDYNIQNIIIPQITTPVNSAWDRENYSREYIRNFLLVYSQPDDVIIFSDCDEIPDFRTFDIDNLEMPCTLSMDLFYYNLDSVFPSKWSGCVIFKRDYLEKKTMTDIRGARHTFKQINSGWHMSYFFTIKGIIQKLKDFSHQEYNKPAYTNEQYITECIRKKASLFNLDRPPTYMQSYTGPLPRTYDMMPEYMKYCC